MRKRSPTIRLVAYTLNFPFDLCSLLKTGMSAFTFGEQHWLSVYQGQHPKAHLFLSLLQQLSTAWAFRSCWSHTVSPSPHAQKLEFRSFTSLSLHMAVHASMFWHESSRLTVKLENKSMAPLLTCVLVSFLFDCWLHFLNKLEFLTQQIWTLHRTAREITNDYMAQNAQTYCWIWGSARSFPQWPNTCPIRHHK